MPEPLIAVLIGVTLASLVASLCWAAWEHPGRRSGKTEWAGPFCIWCLYRRGDVCIHPMSPVYPDGCSPVCTGAQRCEVREVKRWRSML